MDDFSDDDLSIVFASQIHAGVDSEQFHLKDTTCEERDQHRSPSLITKAVDSGIAHIRHCVPAAEDSLDQLMDEFMGICGSEAETQKVPWGECVPQMNRNLASLNLDEFHHRRDYLTLPSHDHLVIGQEEKVRLLRHSNDVKADEGIICVIESGSEGGDPTQVTNVPAFGVPPKRRTSMKKAPAVSLPKPKAKKRSIAPKKDDDQQKVRGRPKMTDQERIAHLQKLLQKETMARFRMKHKTRSKEDLHEDDQLWKDLIGIGDNPLRKKKYVGDHLRLLMSVGQCSSPGGSRAPLARMVSHLMLDMD